MNAPTVDIYQAEDGAWVVHIDTDEAGECTELGPRPLRVYINDGTPGVYENPPPQGDRDPCYWCSGSGKIVGSGDDCPDCKGTGRKPAPAGHEPDNCPTCGGHPYDCPTDCPDEAHNYGVEL